MTNGNIDGAIFMSERAFDQTPFEEPMKTVKNYFIDNCDHLGLDLSTISVSISNDYSFNPYWSCSSNVTSTHKDSQLDCVLSKFDNWKSGKPAVGSDFNLMLLNEDDYPGNVLGVGYLNTNACVSRGAGEIYAYHDSTNRPRFDSSDHYLSTAIHEIGHNLGVDHGKNNKKDGTIYKYDPWNNRYARTPHDPGKGNENQCGTVSASPSNPDQDFYYWEPCTGQQIEDYYNG